MGTPSTSYIQGVTTIEDGQSEERDDPAPAPSGRARRRADCPAPSPFPPAVTSSTTRPVMIHLYSYTAPACEQPPKLMYTYSGVISVRDVDASTAPRCLLKLSIILATIRLFDKDTTLLKRRIVTISSFQLVVKVWR
ncbi:hypothetical protein Y032_0029g1995 [Ancylostoma ceylanicum]|uniref:Uncharacterized protein n=1 Tax=Ancylostoma ceylanicum TaxID=53326 RepID=A0A016UT50_9BILA|nr:hypothetical protein Y032_0029g1995 [Ancylostoma ceylanicum]